MISSIMSFTSIKIITNFPYPSSFSFSFIFLELLLLTKLLLNYYLLRFEAGLNQGVYKLETFIVRSTSD